MNYDSNFQRASHNDFSNKTDGTRPWRTGRWAIILAGGSGTRLRALTRVITGDERPKQFCSILGSETLLDQTRSRAALAVRPTQTLFVLTKTHERFFSSLLTGVPAEQLVVQPSNAGTAPAILYSLLRLSRLHPASSVAILPSDHYVSDDAAFMSHVKSAFDLVHSADDLVILLGIKPQRPETEYGWIEPVSPSVIDTPHSVYWVRRFWEKPEPKIARSLMKEGGLWNSFVMVGRVSAFLKMIQHAVPELFSRFLRIEPRLNTDQEKDAVREL